MIIQSSAPRVPPVIVPMGGHILIVDDEPSLAKSCGRQLTAAGFTVELAESGAEAMARFEKGSFDAMVSDVSMPDTSGLDLIRLTRARNPDLPVLLMTGTPSIDTAAHAVDLGALRYLVKPVAAEVLVEAVRSAVRVGQLAKAKREALDLLSSGGLGIADRANLERGFENALKTMWMAFQPIVSWSKRKVVGYEALVRTEEPSLPHPGALFNAAERLGRVNELGCMIRDRATLDFAAAPDDVLLFINLHMLDLNEVSLYLASTALTMIAKRAVLEITERASFDEVKNMRARVAVLRQLGFRIAIDDLGAGYAGLTSFALLDPEVVKLDMSLIRDVHREPVKQRIIRSMVSLCAESNMMVIAEGIEHAEERDQLAELNCDLMQGYLFARPGRPFPTIAW